MVDFISERKELLQELEEVDEAIRTIRHHLAYPKDTSRERKIKTETALRYKIADRVQIENDLALLRHKEHERKNKQFMAIAKLKLPPELFMEILSESSESIQGSGSELNSTQGSELNSTQGPV